MASSGESGSESDSWSGSNSDTPSDLGAATVKPSSAAKGGVGTSQPPSKRARKGGDPSALVHIGEDLVVTQSELLDKMKELKCRFVKASRTGRIGKTPHEQNMFELCRVLGAKAKVAPAAAEEECPPPPRRRAGSLLARQNCRRKSTGPACLLRLKFYGIELDEEVLRVGTRMVGRTKVEEVKKRFREFQMAELKMAAERAALVVERAALKPEVTKLFVDAYLAATK